ncbi:hypothetical protein U9293_26990, partial [Escherichia coli]
MMVVILTPVDGIIRWLPRGFSCSPESAYLRRLAGLNVMPSSFEGCLMQTSQKSGINYLDIFRLNTF